jgi:hypothetical protein
MGWHVTLIKQKGKPYRNLAGILEERRQVARPRCRGKVNVKVDLEETRKMD